MRLASFVTGLSGLALISGCSTLQADGPPTQDIYTSNTPQVIPGPLKKSRYGNPDSYVVFGKRYHVASTARGYDKRGVASWYGTKFQGQLTSSGEVYDMYKLTAASRTIPIPALARVTNLENGRSIIVKINDRGPFAHNRIIDLSYAAAKKLKFAKQGTAFVEVKTITYDNDEPKLNPIQYAKITHTYLQVGAFSNHKNAIELKSRLNSLTNEPVKILPILSHHRTLYRVQIGPLVDSAKSDRLHLMLKNLGLGKAVTVNI